MFLSPRWTEFPEISNYLSENNIIASSNKRSNDLIFASKWDKKLESVIDTYWWEDFCTRTHQTNISQQESLDNYRCSVLLPQMKMLNMIHQHHQSV